MKELIKAIAEAKKEIGKISKDSNNPFYKSKYFDINQLLEHVEPVLQKHQLLLIQPIQDNKVYSTIYHTETGDMFNSCIELPNLTDPQKLGSAITYYRRYTLQSLLGLQAEDDDANKASNKTPKQSNSDKVSNKIKMVDKGKHWNNCIQKLQLGQITMEVIRTTYQLTPEQETQLSTYEKK